MFSSSQETFSFLLQNVSVTCMYSVLAALESITNSSGEV